MRLLIGIDDLAPKLTRDLAVFPPSENFGSSDKGIMPKLAHESWPQQSTAVRVGSTDRAFPAHLRELVRQAIDWSFDSSSLPACWFGTVKAGKRSESPRTFCLRRTFEAASAPNCLRSPPLLMDVFTQHQKGQSLTVQRWIARQLPIGINRRHDGRAARYAFDCTVGIDH